MANFFHCMGFWATYSYQMLGFIRESPSNSLKKSGLGIIVICPDGCLEAMLHQLLFLAHLIGDRLIPVARSFELMRGI